MVLKLLLFGYIALVAKGRKSGSKILLQLWRYVFRVQGRVLYFFCSTFWVKAINVVQDTREEIKESEYYSVMIISCLMMALEFFFSLYLSIYYVHILPSKQLTSAKDNNVEIIDLVQKLVIQILAATLDFDKLSSLWIFACVNLAIDRIRNRHYFFPMPDYHFKTMFYKSPLLTIVASLNISCVISCIVRSIDTDSSSLALVVIIWIILSILMIKSGHVYLKRRFWNLLLDPSLEGPNLLVHRISAVKELREMTKGLFEFNQNYDWTLLANNTINSRIKEIFKINEGLEGGPLSINNKEGFNKILGRYLEKLMEMYPRDKFLRLYTAHFYIKNLKMIRAPIDILMKLRGNSGLRINLNTELLLMEIQNSLKEKYSKLAEEKGNHLDLSKFIYEKTLYIQAKEKIISQADLQIKICYEAKKESPNLALIFNDSQRLTQRRTQTVKFIKKMLELMSDHHIEPLLLYARYYLVLNHSMNENAHFTKMYTQRLQKYNKYFEQDKLVDKNMFAQDISFCIFSNNEANLGKVFYASKAMTRLLGQSNDTIMTMNIMKNSPPSIRDFYIDYHKSIAKQGEKLIQNKIQRTFLYSKECYLVEVETYANIHPFVTSEFYLNYLQRTVRSKREFMYVLENGDIDSTTKNIAEKLGVFPSLKNTSPGTEFNLKHISDQLVEINNAFNTVFYNVNIKPDEWSPEVKKAQEIYSLCTTSGKDLVVKPINGQQDEIYLYSCKVTNLSMGKALLKLFTFEEKRLRDPKRLADPNDLTPMSYIGPPGQSPIKNFTEDQDINEELESSASSNHVESTVEEKRDGWIDSYAINSTVPYFDSNSLGMTNRASFLETQRAKETTRQLLDPQSDTRDGISTPGLPPKQRKSQIIQVERKVSAGTTGGKNERKTEAKMSRKDHIRSRLSVATSRLSKFSLQKRISYLYEVSLNTKYYPKLYKLLLGLFCLAFILLIVSQFVLKDTLDNNVENLRASKDILRGAQLRNYQQITVASTARMTWEIHTGGMEPSTFGSFASFASLLPYIFSSYVQQLSETNEGFLVNTSSLNQDISERLFAPDVNVYDTYFDADTQIIMQQNHFQAVDGIVETALRLSNLADLTEEEGQYLVNFVMRNSLNNLLMKSEDICALIRASLNSQRSDIENIIEMFLIVLLLIFGSFLGILSVILYQQYLKQMNNLSAFCRVNPAKLNEVLSMFVRFKHDVENEQVEDQSEHFSMRKLFKEKTTATQDSVKRDYNKNPNCWELQKSYGLLISKLVILITMVMIAIGVTSVINQKTIKSSKTMQGQVYFLDHAKSRISLSSVCFVELIATNNTGRIERNFILDELNDLVTQLDEIRIEIYSTLLDNNEFDDADSGYIEALLYGDACPFVETSPGSCASVVARGYKPGLVYVLNGLTNLAKRLIQEYEDSNKTEAALQELNKEFFEDEILLYLVATTETQLIADLINEQFEKDLDSTHRERVYVIVEYFVLVIVVSLLVWRIVLTKFRESINEFKNVLSVLPGELVLASFILRTFLLKTSKGVLDPIKSDLS